MVNIKGQYDWLYIRRNSGGVPRKPSKRIEHGWRGLAVLGATSGGETCRCEALFVAPYEGRYAAHIFVAWFVVHVVVGEGVVDDKS